MAIQASDLKNRYNLNCTEKTLRNKFAQMEMAELVSYIGQRPKRYFITQQGIALLNKERQTLLQFQQKVPELPDITPL